MNLEPLRIIRREATALGLPLPLVRNRKHQVFRVSDNAGRSRLLVVPVSASDFRAVRQARAFLRRLAKQMAGLA